MNIWSSLGNIYQIQVEVQIAEKQYELSRLEGDKHNFFSKLIIYERKIKELEDSFLYMRKPKIVISLSEYEIMKSDLYFYKEKRADTKMYIDMLDAIIVDLNTDIKNLEIKKEKLKTVIIELKNVRPKIKK